MITALIGTPGAGKSYESVVYHLIPALKSGRMVVTNLPINVDLLFSDFIWLDKSLLILYPSVDAFSNLNYFDVPWRNQETNQGPLFIIDEAHKPLPRETRTKPGTPREIEEYFAEHRHYGHDILLITQQLSKISHEITGMIEITYKLIKGRVFGVKDGYVRKVLQGIRGAAMDTQTRKYNPLYYKYYTSHTHSTVSVIESQATDTRPLHLVYRRFSFIAIALGVVLCLLIGNPFKPRVKDQPYPQSGGGPAPAGGARIADKPVTVMPPADPPKAVAEKQPQPYDGYGLHIVASITRMKDKSFIYYFSQTQNGVVVNNLTNNDINKAGYAMRVYHACLVSIQYPGFDPIYIHCDSPRVQMNPSTYVQPVISQNP